jgi:hypothetical protein
MMVPGGQSLPRSRTTTQFEPPWPGLLDPNEFARLGMMEAQGDDLEDEMALRGVVVIDLAREVIARFSGNLILNEQPERQPEIVFDRGPQFRDEDDE